AGASRSRRLAESGVLDVGGVERSARRAGPPAALFRPVRKLDVEAQPRRAHLRFPLPRRNLRARAEAVVWLLRAALARARTVGRPGRSEARSQGGCVARARLVARRRRAS